MKKCRNTLMKAAIFLASKVFGLSFENNGCRNGG